MNTGYIYIEFLFSLFNPYNIAPYDSLKSLSLRFSLFFKRIKKQATMYPTKQESKIIQVAITIDLN